MRRATALLAAVAFAWGGSARAASLESMALRALKGVCLGDATRRRDQLAQALGWTSAPIEPEGSVSRVAWDKAGDGGHVRIISVAAKNEFSGNYCVVVVHGEPGRFLDRAKSLLFDVQFGTFPPPKRPDLTGAWEMAKSGYDGHHSWTVLGGMRPFAKPPLSPGETLDPLAFVQVTYFFDR